jgi:hypothetical protein
MNPSTLLRDFQALPARRRFLLVAGFVLALLLLVLVTGKPNPEIGHQASRTPASLPDPAMFPAAPDESRIDLDGKAMALKSLPSLPYGGSRPDEFAATSGEPRVSYSAELAVVTKEFAHTRSAMEEILDRHRGYTAKLRMGAHTSGSVLSATLRVPASEYSSALSELKAVGDVERDEEAADEIVQQHGDLEARLQNAQNAEQHLEKLVKDHPGMAAPLLQVQQQQLAQLRGEIDRLRAERQSYDSRAVFSNIYFSLREERLAPVESFGAQLRGSTVNGLSDVLRVLSALLLFCVNYGPSLLLWAAILFFPARFVWRRSRPALQQNPA